MAYAIYLRYNMQGRLLWPGTFNEKPKAPKQPLTCWRKHILGRANSKYSGPGVRAWIMCLKKKKEFNVAEDSEWGKDNEDETREVAEGKAGRAS